MTELIVSLEDSSIIDEIKNAIKKMRGVVGVKENNIKPLHPSTLQALKELEEGDTIVCDSMADYKKLIDETLQD